MGIFYYLRTLGEVVFCFISFYFSSSHSSDWNSCQLQLFFFLSLPTYISNRINHLTVCTLNRMLNQITVLLFMLFCCCLCIDSADSVAYISCFED